MKPVVAFDPEGARLLVKYTREAMRRPRGVVRPSQAPRPLAPTKYAVVATQITAASGMTLGAGTATLQVVTVADPSATPGATPGVWPAGFWPSGFWPSGFWPGGMPGPPKATYASQGDVIPVYSGASTPIAGGRLIIVAIIDGNYHVIVDFC